MKKLIIIILTLVLSGCSSTKYIEVSVDRTKIEYRDRTLVDTPILYLTPNVPGRNHSFKNDYIINSGYRYINASLAVGTHSDGT